jgi:hypothetical protein
MPGMAPRTATPTKQTMDSQNSPTLDPKDPRQIAHLHQAKRRGYDDRSQCGYSRLWSRFGAIIKIPGKRVLLFNSKITASVPNPTARVVQFALPPAAALAIAQRSLSGPLLSIVRCSRSGSIWIEAQLLSLTGMHPPICRWLLRRPPSCPEGKLREVGRRPTVAGRCRV